MDTAQILKDHFPDATLTQLTGGYTNQSYWLEGSDPPVMAKIFTENKSSAKVEMNALTLLNPSGVTPGLRDFFEENGSLFVMMDYIKGINGQRILDEGDLDTARKIYKRLGIDLATRIHSIKRGNVDPVLPVIEMVSSESDLLNVIPNPLKDKVSGLLKVAVEEHNITLIHGDYGPHNILLTQESLFVIDWEWAGWGNPLQDVAWVVWFVGLHYPQWSSELSGIFLRSYRAHSDVEITEEAVEAFALSKAVHILNWIGEGNQEARKEWLRRLEWTAETRLMG